MDEDNLVLLEIAYENLLCEKEVELVEGYGLEGDWDRMSDEEKVKALEGAIGYLQEFKNGV